MSRSTFVFEDLLEMTVDQRAQAGLVRVQRRRLQQLAQFVHRDALVHFVQPGFYLVETAPGRVFPADSVFPAGKGISISSCFASAR